MRYFLPVLLLALAWVGAGCAPQPAALPTAQGTDATAETAIERVRFEPGVATEPGPVTFRFALADAAGRELGPADLKVVHEKLVHLLLVRDDLTGFQHLHPSYVDGKWEASTTIPEVGGYQLYFDVTQVAGTGEVLRATRTFGGATTTPRPPVPVAGQLAEVAAYRATLSPAAVRAGEPVTLAFALTTQGKPVATIAPYLGAYGHVVILQQGAPETFVHVHPLDEAAPRDGVVRFSATFPASGRYTVYGQFAVGGEVRTFPIAIDVAASGAAAPAAGHGGHH